MKLSKSLISLYTIVTFLFLVSCGRDTHKPIKVNHEFKEWISAFTSGVVSKKSNFEIHLTKPTKLFTEIDALIDEDLFDFSPSVNGKAYWKDSQTMVFIPDELLKSGTTYQVTFALGKVQEVTSKFEEFLYDFSVINQHFSVEIDGIKSYDNQNLIWNSFQGQLYSTDFISEEEVQSLLEIQHNDKALSVSWNSDASGRNHEFKVDSIERKEEPVSLLIKWDGSPIDVDIKGEEEFVIPSLSDFKLMDVKVLQQPEQYVKLTFSDPLDGKQDLTGLIRFEDYNDFKFEITDNLVKAYPKARQIGTKTILVETGVINSIGYKLIEQTSLEISFIEVKPNIRISHTGVILPSSNDLIVPFQAVNLNAVDVNIIKIYENNMHQFFQNNTHTGSRELSRVGRSVLNKKIDLTSDKAIDYGVWNNFSLDMSELIKPDPGAIYRIDLSFKNEYSLYSCEEEEESEYNYDVPENTYSYYGDGWGYYDYYYYNDYYYYDYNWRDREDPCKSSYYYGKHASTNILASNIGLLAKSGFEKKILIAVTDIRTAEPWRGVDIELFDYQHQKVGEAVSNSEGLVWVDLQKKPQLLIASKGDEKGYLKLEDGQSLSMAHFNVQGSQVQNGLKGFIYGERGVWRPGDTLFLNFIVEDKQKILPEDHPVKFELYNSQTQLVKTIVKKNGVNGIFNFTVKTADDAPTGTWTAKVKVGGALFTKYLKIEAIKPNRLKIKLDYEVEKLSASKPEQKGKLEVKWLHGATAKNLKAKVDVTLSRGTTKFEGYEDYHFTDHTRSYYPNEELIFDGKIDENGHALIPSSVKVRDAAPGMLKAYFKVRVFEESGDFSIDRFSIPYSPYPSYVGVKLPQGDRNRTLLTDSTYEAQIVTVDENGNPVDVDNLDVTVFKVNWRWWWDSSNDYAANYTGSSYSNQVQRFVVSTKNGKGNVKFKIEYPDWGRYMIRISDRQGKHSTAKAFYMDWPGWYKRGNRTNPGGASVLSFSTDKDNYKVGEMVQVKIPAATKGRALVTVESGSKILKAEWLDVQEEEFNHEIEVTDEMAPNVYINITLIQPHEHDNSLPIRLYGVQPIDVTDPNTILKPVINMPESIRPETTIKVKVSEENNKKMTYTLAIVDEGLLDLTRFKTPNPHPVFYAHEALGVKTWDLYNYVIGAYGGKLERILSIGGDEGAKGKDKEKINRFKPMVKFLGPFELASGKSNTHDIAIPNYIGSVRTMVIAAQDGAYGKSEETTPVKKPLMVLATLPRVLGPDETVKLPVTIFAMEDHIKDVKIEIIANNLFNSGFEATKTIHFDKPDDMVINFELQVAKKIGKGEVQVIVTSGKEKATYEIELEVRNPNPSRTEYIDAIVDAGSTWESNYDLFGIDGTNKVTIEFSNIPPIDFDRRLRYLIGYPHGCIEQVTSQAFPQLYLKDILDADERIFKRASDNVKIALEKLKRFQYSDGGMSYWPSGYRSSDWGTSYAGHFMLEAEAKGYALPPGMKSNWISYQKRTSRSYNSRQFKDPRARYKRYSYDMAQSYRLFTLALAGKPEIGAMNRLKEDNRLGLTGIWRLAAAYHLAGQPEVAQKIIAGKKIFIHEDLRYGYTYGSRGRNHAMILEAMAIMEMRSEAVSLMLAISESLSSARWMSTQTTAYSLLAMVKFAGPNLTSKQMTFKYEINSDQKESINTQLPIKQIKVTSLDIKNGHISVTNNSEGILYTRVLISGKPLHGDEQASENNLGIRVKYVNMKGKAIDITKLEQGTDFIAEVTVSNPNTTQWIQDLALTQIFPSGWEIHNTRMDQGPNIHEEDKPDYQDIRDDRVYTYFYLTPHWNYGKLYGRTFTVVLNAAYLGNFYLPGFKAEAMYDNRISATSKGQWVQVVKPGE